MPKFKINNRVFDIPESDVAEFQKENPEATRQAVVKKSTQNTNGVNPIIIEPYAYGTNKPHASKYDKARWLKWAEETGFQPKTTTVKEQNEEFQTHLMRQKGFDEAIKKLHSNDPGGFGMPNAGKPVDSYLGERWDKIMTELYPDKVATTPTSPTPTQKVKVISPNTGPVVSHGDPANERKLPPIESKWWLQDTLKAGNAALNFLQQKPYYPWEAPVDFMTPRLSYLSPERQLAENQSQMRMATNALAQFTGPQAFNARFNEIYGKGFANAANTIADVHNRNIGIHNQQAMADATAYNQQSQQKAQRATGLWDKYQTVNQQFQNSKSQARNELVNSLTQGITNAANTYNLNQLYPQYAANPSTGGHIKFHSPKDIDPAAKAASLEQSFANKLADKRFTQLANSEAGQNLLWKMTQQEHGLTPDDFAAEYEKTKGVTPVSNGYRT